ncbi:MAG: leucine-rich repeat domain-containing protein [Clostridia bacterium]|nr:leucine-rich repeat domain-containing protein [Clostridia bacterium]
MKKRAIVLTIFLLAACLMLTACSDMAMGGLIQELFFEFDENVDSIPEEHSQLLETIPEDFTIPEEVPDNVTVLETTAPDVIEPEPENISSQGLKFKSNGNGTCKVSGIGTCTDTNIVIPSVSPDGDRVTSIGDDAFYGCSRLKSIVIPDGVTSISDSAFQYCDNLTSVVIPDSVTSIGDSAFYDCSRLTSIVIPDGVTSIGDKVFTGCSRLTSIVIPDGVTSIGVSEFYSCKSLASIVIPEGVTIIDDFAFSGCSGLTSIVIPDSVTSIGNEAFWNCDSLTDVYYTGTEQEWAAITIGEYNRGLTNATIHFNYQP